MTRKLSGLELARFKEASGAIDFYRQGRDALKASGLVTLLRMFARPYTNDGGANQSAAAYSAAFSEGYNQCIDDLLYFEEQYIETGKGVPKVKADFGGLRIAVEKGDLTVQEAEKISGRK